MTQKNLSCNTTSKPALDKIIPVKPPQVNKKMKPTAKSIGTFKVIEPPHIVANQE